MKTNMIKRVLALLLSAVLVFSLAACGGSTSTADKPESTAPDAPSTDDSADSGEYFVIGNPQPLTGVNALVGEGVVNAVLLAAEEINAAGGLNGQQVKVITYDDQNTPEEAVKIAEKLIDVDKVDFIIGSMTSSCMMAAGRQYNDAKIPVIGNGNSPTWMLQGWEYIYRACPNVAFSVPGTIDVMKELGIQSISVFHGQDDAAKSSADEFIARAKEAGLDILTVESYPEGDTDFSGQIAKIISSDPDTVYCATNGPVQAIFAKQLRQFGFNKLAFNRESFPKDSFEVAGEAMDNWAFVYPYITYENADQATDPDMKEFLNKYNEKYGEFPYHECAYRGYDSMMVMAEAAKIAGSNDKEAIKAALDSITDFKGLGGTIDFSQGDREGLRVVRSWVVVDGQIGELDPWLEAGGYEALKATY